MPQRRVLNVREMRWKERIQQNPKKYRKGKGGSHQDKSTENLKFEGDTICCLSVILWNGLKNMPLWRQRMDFKLMTFTCWKLLSLFYWPFPAFWDSSAFLHGLYLHQSVLGHIQLRYWFTCMENARLHFFCRETQEWGKAFKREASLIRKKLTEGLCVFCLPPTLTEELSLEVCLFGI